MTERRIALGDRSLFPELQADAYLSHAAISPVSALVSEAAAAVLTDYARLGQAAFGHWADQRERLRRKLAELVGTEATNIALTTGTTRGIADLAICLPWKRGQTVLLFEGEFPANVTPWQSAAKLFELEVRFLPRPNPQQPEDSVLAPLERALKSGARLVAVSAVQFQSGLRMPLAEIASLCRANGAELSVDAIQACGIIPLDVTLLDLDYLVCGAHKWLMGLEGAGFVYAKPGAARALVPRTAGWLSHEEGVRFLFEGPGELRYDRPIKPGIQFLESGSSGVVGFAALEAGLGPILELMPARILEQVTGYLDQLEVGLLERGFTSLRATTGAGRSGILSVVPPPALKAAQIAGGLRKRRVFAATPDGLLRFAPHFPNHSCEIPVVLAALDQTLAELRG